ncbi:prolyl oligopeptidase family serine peptidase [Amycolatopsis pigmentata]|uniref:Prolyl oligopeptidase family serine peptidase n=1 Tax=Amycolatopsis pigmentata TaxID=450801 RepID=A0ABW5FYK9_9PSEU
MALIVNDDLRFLFLFVTGDEFPDANEDLLRALAHAWEQAGRRLRDEVAPDLRRAIAPIESTFQGLAAQAFVARMAPFVLGKDNYIDSSAAFFFEVAAILRQLALDVEYLKYVVILELSTLQNEFVWAFAAGAVLGPAVLSWLTGRVAMTRTALETLLEWFNLRLGTMGEKAAVGQELLLGMTLSISNQMLITVAAQEMQFAKGTRTEWSREYLSDAAMVGFVGGLLMPPAFELGRRVARVVRSVTELLDAVLRKAHGARDWHRAFAVGVAHVFRESVHEGTTATVANAILTQQLTVSWSDFTAGASSGVARVSGHLLGHTARKLGIAATAAAGSTVDTEPSLTEKPEPATKTGGTYPDEKPGTTMPGPQPYTGEAPGRDDLQDGADPDELPPPYHASTGEVRSVGNGEPDKPTTAPKSVVESVVPKTIPPEMAGGRPRPRLDIAGIASGFPKTLLDDPNRLKTAEDIVARTHHVDKLRQTGHYDHTLLAVAGTAEGSGTGKATQLSLRVAHEWETNLPPVAPGGAPTSEPGPRTESLWSKTESETAEDRYGLSSWAPQFHEVAGKTDAEQLFTALDYQAGHRPGRSAGSSAFSAQPPEEIEGGLAAVRDRIDKAGRGARAIVFVPPRTGGPGGVWHVVHEPGGVRLKRHDGSPADTLPDKTDPVLAVGLDGEDKVVIADTVDARWNTAGLDEARTNVMLSQLKPGERNRRLQLAATMSWAAADLSGLTDTRRFALIRATAGAMATTQARGHAGPDIEGARRFTEHLARQLRITWPEETDSGSWTVRRTAQHALGTPEARPEQLGEHTGIARDVMDTVFDRAETERLALRSAVFRTINDEVRTNGEEAATELAISMAGDLGLANPEFALRYLRDQADRADAAFKTPDALAAARPVVARANNLAQLELRGLERMVTILVATKLRDGEQAASAYSRWLARFLNTTPEHETPRGPLWTEERVLTAGTRAARTLDPVELPRIRRQVVTIVQRYAAGPELARTPGLRDAVNSLVAEALLGPGRFARKRAKATRLAAEISRDLGLGWTRENFARAVDIARRSPRPPQVLLDHARDWVRRRHDPKKFDDENITEQKLIAVVVVTAETAGITVDNLLPEENPTKEQRLTKAAAEAHIEAIAAALADGLDTTAEDPHLWLEDLTGEAAKNWVEARNAETTAALTETERFTRIRDGILEVYESEDQVPYAYRTGDYFYNFWQDSEHPRGLWRRATLEEYRKDQPGWEILFDLDEVATTENEDWFWQSAKLLGPDYRRALIQLSRGGADATVVREFDLKQGSFVDDGFVLPEAARHQVEWIDEDRIYVSTDFGAGSLFKSGLPRVIKEWRRGDPLSKAKTVYEGEPGDVMVFARHDAVPGYERDFIGRWIDAKRLVTFLRTPDRLVRINVPDDARTSVHRDWLLIQVRSPWTVAGREYRAGTLLVTNFDAYLADSRDLTVLFEPDAHTSLQSYDWTRDHLLLTTLSHVQTEMLVLTPERGWHREPLAGAPTKSIVQVLGTDPQHSNEYLLFVDGFIEPSKLLYGHVGSESATLKHEPAWFDAEGMVVDQYFAESLDGTKIPYFVVRHEAGDGPRPTLLTGYGSLERSRLPSYEAEVGRGWLARGGTYVLANIRGGGEYGPRWYTPTVKEGRHLVYEDFAAIAADLVKRGITTWDQLGIQGGSGGGLLMGVMVTRYPELFGAVVSHKPLLDMRRFHRLLAGATWKSEYGNPDDPAQWAFMQPYSPYENVYSGRWYPPALILTRGLDDRVHPGHGRKMLARMLEQGHDVFFYEIKGGHGDLSTDDAVLEYALTYEFLWSMLTAIDPTISPGRS